MANEPLAVQLATIATTLTFLQRDLEEARLARGDQYKKMEEHSQILSQMDNRMQKVEASLSDQAPTIQEFVTIKQRVVGAGAAGKWLWSAVGAVLTMLGLIVAAKSGLIHLLTGK